MEKWAKPIFSIKKIKLSLLKFFRWLCPPSNSHPTPHTHFNRLGLSDGWAAVLLDFIGSRFWLATAHWLLLEWSAGWHRTELVSKGWVYLLWPGVEWWKADLVTVMSEIPSTTSGRRLCRADLRGSPMYHGPHVQTGLWFGALQIPCFPLNRHRHPHILGSGKLCKALVQTLIGIWLLIVQQQQAKVPVMSLLILAHSRIPSCVCVYGGE